MSLVVVDEIFERRIYSAFWEGEPTGEPNFWRAWLLPCRNFSVGQEPDPPNYYSPVANRYSLPFCLSRSIALPISVSLVPF